MVRPSVPVLPAFALAFAAACGGSSPASLDAGVADGSPDAIFYDPPDARPPPPDARPPDADVPDASTVNCFDLPIGLFPAMYMPGFVASEDLAFDDAGNVIESDTNNIYKTTHAGVRSTFVPGFQFRAGMRLTPAGDLIVNDDFSGELVRVDTAGVRHTILSGLSYPNGMEVDPDGYVYVSEQNADRVLRVDPIAETFTVLSWGEISAPNGLSFDPYYQALYIDGFSGVGTVYQLKINADGTPGELTEWATGVGSGLLDGIAVDECGNVYVCDYGNSTVIRIDVTGTRQDIVISGSAYRPNMDWGSGIGGWDDNLLYFVSVGYGLEAYDVGFRSKPRW